MTQMADPLTNPAHLDTEITSACWPCCGPPFVSYYLFSICFPTILHSSVTRSHLIDTRMIVDRMDVAINFGNYELQSP